ncbi:hypothetical protein OG21DRAFT_566847 [Imleria badia]|nr:hypothetical protein OG21DRAFT_566847 [Imleria badia]
MLLVFGRPGAGCSTFHHRKDYHDVQGDVFYDSFSSKEIEQRYRGDVMYCPEDGDRDNRPSQHLRTRK